MVIRQVRQGVRPFMRHRTTRPWPSVAASFPSLASQPSSSSSSASFSSFSSFSSSRSASPLQYPWPRRPVLGCPSCHGHQQHGRLLSSVAASTATTATPASSSSSSLVDLLLSLPVDTAAVWMEQLHTATGTPWFVTLSLVAVGVNLLFRLPFSVYARRLAQKRAGLTPLLQAWAAAHARSLHAERMRAGLPGQPGQSGQSGPSAAPDAEVIKRYRRTAKRVYAKFGLQQWKLFSSLATLPPWLIVIEALRRMCGAPTGLLGLIIQRGGSGGAAAAAAGETAREAAGETTAQLSSAADSAEAASTLANANMATLVDPSFATGGCLWFPDLTVPDPYHILPFLLSALMVANVLPATDAGRRALFGLAPQGSTPLTSSNSNSLVSTEGAVSRGLQRTLLLMSVSVGFVTMHFPSAIHLYWLSSSATSLLMTRTIHRRMPLPEQNIRPSNKMDFPWVQPLPESTREKKGL